MQEATNNSDEIPSKNITIHRRIALDIGLSTCKASRVATNNLLNYKNDNTYKALVGI